MEIGKYNNKVYDPQVAQLLDNILDAVLALKARLADSNMDSNSIGGISSSSTRSLLISSGVMPGVKAPKNGPFPVLSQS